MNVTFESKTSVFFFLGEGGNEGMKTKLENIEYTQIKGLHAKAKLTNFAYFLKMSNVETLSICF